MDGHLELTCSHISGVTFDEAWGDSITTNLDGISVRILGLKTLLKNKRASGRAKDLADIEEISAKSKRPDIKK